MGDRSLFFSSLIEKGQFRVDDKGHALLFGQPLFLVPPRVLIKLQMDLREYMEAEEIEGFMADLGAYQTEQALERYEDRYNWDSMSKEKILRQGFKMLKVLGWGEISVDMLTTEQDDAGFRLVVAHPTFPAVYQEMDGDQHSPVCHYLRGMLRRSMEAIAFGEDVEIEETSCAAVEGDTCVFEGSPRD